MSPECTLPRKRLIPTLKGDNMAVAKRHIDQTQKTITMEFSNGNTFPPIEMNAVTDALTKMIGQLEGRVAKLELESKARNTIASLERSARR